MTIKDCPNCGGTTPPGSGELVKRVTTHYPECWRDHHECAREVIESSSAEIVGLREALRQCEIVIEDQWAKRAIDAPAAIHAVHALIDKALSPTTKRP